VIERLLRLAHHAMTALIAALILVGLSTHWSYL